GVVRTAAFSAQGEFTIRRWTPGFPLLHSTLPRLEVLTPPSGLARKCLFSAAPQLRSAAVCLAILLHASFICTKNREWPTHVFQLAIRCHSGAVRHCHRTCGRERGRAGARSHRR